jgi:hypothetical protein
MQGEREAEFQIELRFPENRSCFHSGVAEGTMDMSRSFGSGLGELHMKVIDKSGGMFAIDRSESYGFRAYLAKEGIQCDPCVVLTAGWAFGSSGKVPEQDQDRLRLLHADDIEKVERPYRTWKEDGQEQ